MLAWSLHNLAGERLATLDAALPGSWVDIEGLGRRTAEVTLSTADRAAGHVYPFAVVLRAWDGDVGLEPVFAGVLMQPIVDLGAGTIRVAAAGPRIRLESWAIGLRSGVDELAGHATGNPWRWEGVPQGTMLARLVDYAQPTASELAAGIPGHGIVPGTIVPGTMRDREYAAGAQIAEAMDQLADVQGGPDWDLVTIWDEEHPERLARLDVADSIGRDLTGTVQLEYGLGRNSADHMTWSPGPTIANRVLGVGEAPSYDGSSPTPPAAPSFRGNQIESQMAFGLWGSVEAYASVTEQPTVAAHVAARLATESWPVDHFEIRPRAGYRVQPDRPPWRLAPDGDLWLGDWFTARGHRDNVILDLTGRVIGARREVLDDGSSRTTLRAAPRENRAVSS